MSLLLADGLTVAMGRGADALAVLRDLSFAVPPGRVLGLVGESGAGKSMVGRAIAGNLPVGFAVAAGSLRFGGDDLVRLSPERRRALLGDRICFIPQEPLTALNPLMTLEEQFAEHLARLGVPKPERRARILVALEEVRLRAPAQLLGRYPFQLSGGQCQRVLIAMAFASRPALIVADEPTTALDVSTQSRVVELIRRLQTDHGTALLFITHDLRLASRISDEVLVLYAGDMVEQGPSRVVMGAPRHPYARSLKASIPTLAGPVRRLTSLPDQMPGVATLRDLPGCRFAPRCPVADPACAATVPAVQDLGGGHMVRASAGCVRSDIPPADARPLTTPRHARAVASPILSLEGVWKRFPGRRAWHGPRGAGVDAVRDVSLHVAPGEFVGIVGESGSGKSTLARLIMGLERPTAGRIAIDGVDVTAAGAQARTIRLGTLQMVFQDPQSALNPRRSVLRLVTQPLEAAHRPRGAEDSAVRARALLRETGLPPELLDRFPSQLSGGQKQRVNIARALCITPRLLVADEIVSGLDVSVQAQILNLLLDLHAQRGFGLMLISHDLAVVRYLCSRVLVMHDGVVVESGAVEDVFAAPRHAHTRELLTSIPPDDPDAVWPAAARDAEAAGAA